MAVAVAAAAAAATPALDVIKEGDHVIFDEHGEKKSIHVIVPNGRAKVGKFRIPVGQLVGAPWGSTYKLAVDGSHLIPVTEPESIMGPAVDEIDKDNATLVDLNQHNQKLSSDDIAAMAASGKAGQDIIAALCTNSATFEGKTEFAQEKYKKRKARKYMTQLTLRKPTGWGMCEVMFDKAPTGIWNLRPDSLALLLSLANVAAHSRVLLLENCQGLLVAACAERLGGHGALCCVGTGGKQPSLSGLRQLNLGEAERAVVCMAQLDELQEAAQSLAAQKPPQGAPQQQQQQQQPQQQQTNGSNNSSHQLQQSSQSGAAANPAADAGPAGAQATDAAAPMAVDGEAPTQATAAAAAGMPVVAAAAAGPAAQVHEDEVMALYEDIPEVHEVPAGKRTPKSPAHHPTKKQRRSAGEGQQQQQQQQSKAGQKAAEPTAEQRQTQSQQKQQQQEAEEAAVQAAGGPEEQQQDGEEQDAAGGAGGSSKRSYNASPEQLQQLLTRGFNSCVIAAPRLQPSSILQEVLPLLAPSSPFVVFSPWMQPLAEAMVQLQASKAAVMLQLQESWLRPYQVLPGRTHPHMSMTTGGTGGYILSGITVAAPGADSSNGLEQDGGAAGAAGASRGRGGGRRGGRRGRGRR